MEIDAHKQKFFLLVLAGILLLACLLDCWNINQSFWWDEIWSTMLYVKAGSLWGTVTSIGYYFNNHILYSLLARGSIQLFGDSEVSARLPAVVLGLLAIVTMFLFGKKFLGDACGLFSALLLAVSAFHIDHSTEARGYSGLALFSLLSSYFFLIGLRANTKTIWLFYILSTVLGCYMHTFMSAVCITQVCCFLLFVLVGYLKGSDRKTAPIASNHFLISLCCASLITCMLYAPVFPTVLRNMSKVRLVTVSRMPFIANLLTAMVPGVKSLLGSIVYGILGLCGLYGISRKDSMLGIYTAAIISVPLLIYLAFNPMFMFERYFIFALPFLLLIISYGIVVLNHVMPGRFKTVFVFICLMLVGYIQLPSIKTVLSQDRQNYREAVQYIEKQGITPGSDLVFSIGYAGEHFNYYAHSVHILVPETIKEFLAMTQGKKRIWCLITAWLPSIRPVYEDQILYSEKCGQREIYDVIKKHFCLQKYYPSRFPVEIYYLQH